ncbi:ABC transporter permease subunit [bacterium]|nr:ABC transporter permease subunit [bacterium]
MLKNILSAEWLKLKHSKIVPITFAAFALGPVMGAIAMYLLGHATNNSPMLQKAQAMNMSADWSSMLNLIAQVAGIGGVIVFGFVASWIFGREHADNTTKDWLAIPAGRSAVVNAKFIVYACWCILLLLSNIVLATVFGLLLGLEHFSAQAIGQSMLHYSVTSVLVILLGFPVGFMALAGKGYLSPLGFVILMIVTAQIIGAIGYGKYFPWAVPGLYSQAANSPMSPNAWSYLIVLCCGLVGFAATHLHINRADQS